MFSIKLYSKNNCHPCQTIMKILVGKGYNGITEKIEFQTDEEVLQALNSLNSKTVPTLLIDDKTILTGQDVFLFAMNLKTFEISKSVT
jgi:glutaredoxin